MKSEIRKRASIVAHFVFCISYFVFGAVHAAVVINEVVYDPKGTDAGSEWVELYNNGTSAVDLTGWVLQKDDNEIWADSTTAVVANLSGTIGPRSYYLIEETEAATLATADVFASSNSLALSNATSKAEGIRLLNASGTGFVVVDTLVYGTPDDDGLGAEGGAGSEAAKVAGGSSIARIADGLDSQNNAADFLEDPTPTPRAFNDPAGVVRVDMAGTISYPNPFFPALHGNVTLTTPERVLSALNEIRIYSVAGELVRTLRQSTWDGRNDDGEFVSAGLYYYVLETDRGKSRGKVTLIR